MTFKFLALFQNLGFLEGIFVFCKHHLVKKLYSYPHAKSQIIEMKSVRAINICKITLSSLRSMSFLKIFLHQVQYYIWGFQNVFICLNLKEMSQIRQIKSLSLHHQKVWHLSQLKGSEKLKSLTSSLLSWSSGRWTGRLTKNLLLLIISWYKSIKKLQRTDNPIDKIKVDKGTTSSSRNNYPLFIWYGSQPITEEIINTIHQSEKASHNDSITAVKSKHWE